MISLVVSLLPALAAIVVPLGLGAVMIVAAGALQRSSNNTTPALEITDDTNVTHHVAPLA